MDPTVLGYLLYLLISGALTVVVGRSLQRHGKAFLTDVLGNPSLAASVSYLLVIGFYLVSLGFIALWLDTDAPAVGARAVVEMVSVKVGAVALLLGTMHLINMLVFNAIRRRRIREHREHTERAEQRARAFDRTAAPVG